MAGGLGLLLALLFGLGLAAAHPPVPKSVAQPAAPNSAAHRAAPKGLATGYEIAQFADDDLAARAITFTAGSSGLTALELSGLPVVTKNDPTFGTEVCSIGGVGCPASNCFCGGSDGDTYWNYEYWNGSAWQMYTSTGPGGSTLANGAVEGWRWADYGTLISQPAQPVTSAVQALDWLRGQQSATDGGFGDDYGTAQASLAVGADDYAADTWRVSAGAPTLEGYDMANGGQYSGQGAGDAGLLALGTVGTDVCRPLGAMEPAAYYNSGTGAYAQDALDDAWAMLGSRAISQTLPAKALIYLAGLQQPNGGWEYSSGLGTESDITALALQALVAAGEPVSNTVVTRGLAYLKTAQNADGGFTEFQGGASEADSTAWIIQALLATGQDPTAAGWSEGSNTPYGYLLGLQLPNGSIQYQAGSGVAGIELSTEQAIPALLGRPFPLQVMQQAACSGSYLPLIER
jgi:hypothetical protein